MGFVTELLTTADVASILQVSPQRVRTLARDGVLAAVRDEGGAGWLFRADDVRHYQDQRVPRRTAPLPASGAGAGRVQSMPAGGPGVASSAREVAALQGENADLRAENAQLRAEVARLREQCEELGVRLQRSRALSEVLVRELG